MLRWVFLALLLAGSAQAATMPIVNGNAATNVPSNAVDALNGVRDAINAFSPRNLLCDGTNPDVCAPVSATLGVTVNLSNASLLPVNITQINGTGLALGQTTMSASLPVTLASNQSALLVAQSGTWTVQPGNTANTTPWAMNITQIGGGALALGQAAMASSIPVALASNQAAIPVSESGTWTVQPGNTANTTAWLVNAPASPNITNPTSTLTLPSGTGAYTAGQLIANSGTAGSVVNPSFAIATSAGGSIISRLRLSTNDSTSTAWGGQTIRVDLWTTTPTWTNGDRAAWSPATQTGAHLAAYTCTMSSEFGDGAFAECAPTVGNYTTVKLASGTSVFWSLDAITGSGVTGASKVFTLTAELLN